MDRGKAFAKSLDRKLRSAHWFPGTEKPGAPITARTAVRLWKASKNDGARAPIA